MYVDDFVFLCPIETGGYSTVWKVKYKGKKYALKMISKERYHTKIQKKTLKMEIKIHKQLDHENIIKMYNSFEDIFFVYILLELGDDDLFNVYKRKEFSDDDILDISYQIINGLEYIHSKNIIHCDIKMENILLNSKNEIKICDFGLSLQDCHHFSFVGTMECMAPEIIKRGILDQNVDIWSFGILLYYLVFENNPFTIYRGVFEKIIDDQATRDAICNNELKFPEDSPFN